MLLKGGGGRKQNHPKQQTPPQKEIAEEHVEEAKTFYSFILK